MSSQITNGFYFGKTLLQVFIKVKNDEVIVNKRMIKAFAKTKINAHKLRSQTVLE